MKVDENINFFVLISLAIFYHSVNLHRAHWKSFEVTHNNRTSITIMFAGPCKYKWKDGKDYFKSFHNTILLPLMKKKFSIAILIGSPKDHIKSWKSELIEKLPDEIFSSIFTLPTLEFQDPNIFTWIKDFYRGAYMVQYGNLYNLWINMHESITTTFIMKCRFDLIYNHHTPFNVNWLLQYSNNTLLVPSTSFNCNDRWKERVAVHFKEVQYTWPYTMNDQILIGDFPAMQKFFLMYKNTSNAPVGKNFNAEKVLARHVNSWGINVETIELQFSQPGGKYMLGNSDGHGWESSPCKSCFLRNESYYWNHPGRERPPIRRCWNWGILDK